MIRINMNHCFEDLFNATVEAITIFAHENKVKKYLIKVHSIIPHLAIPIISFASSFSNKQ